MADNGKAIDGSALCTQCAMCCHGVLHNWGELEEAEVETMEALGMTIERTPDYLAFSQPCPMIRGTVCSIYEQRPAACSGYKCAMLRRYTAGEIPLDSALALVAEAKGLFARAQAQLPAGMTLRDARGHLRQFLAGAASGWSEGERSARGPALLAAALLNRFIDRHFRLPRETMIMSPKDAALAEAPIAGTLRSGPSSRRPPRPRVPPRSRP